MNSIKNKNYAVLTGDIVKSSLYSEKQFKDIQNALKLCSKTMKKIFPDAVKYNIDIFRGDSWQLLIEEPRLALRAAIFIRAFLKGELQMSSLDTRISIAIGNVEHINSRKISQSRGDAFLSSGDQLDKLKGRFIFSFHGYKNEKYMNLLIQTLDPLITKLKKRQSKSLIGILQGLTQKEISQKIFEGKVSQQAVAQQLDSGDWEIIENVVLFFEEEIRNMCL